MTKRIYGHTASGTPIDDDLVDKLSGQAEAGYDVEEIIALRVPRTCRGVFCVRAVEFERWVQGAGVCARP